MQHVIWVCRNYNVVTCSISSMPLTKVTTRVVNNYQHTTEKQVGVVIFCRDLTKPLILLEIARNYWYGNMLEGLKRLSAQKPKFL